MHEPAEATVEQLLNHLLAHVTSLEDRVDELEDENERLEDRVDELEDDTEQRSETMKGFAATMNGHSDRIDELEQNTSASPPTPQEPVSPETTASPLEQLTNLPEPIVEDHLTENQRRARFVAKDVLDYADKAPKGLVLSSSAISRVLTVRDDETPHTETVSRVMEFLDRFGGDDVYLKIHKGRRIAVFDGDAAHRYGAGSVDPSRCDVITQRASG